VLVRVRELLRGRCAALAKHDFFTGCDQQLYVSPQYPSLKAADANEHSVGNPWFMSSMEFRAGRVMTGEELVDPGDLVRTDFYQRFLKQHGLFHWLCGVLSRSNDVVHYVAVHRSKTQVAFDDADKDLLAFILQHLAISLENHWALRSERSAKVILGGVSDRLATAVFVVDQDGLVLLRNNASDEFLERYQALQIVDARIVAVADQENHALSKAITEIASGVPHGSGKTEKIVSLGGNATQHPLIVSIRAAGKFFCNETHDYRDAAVVLAKISESWRNAEMCSFSEIYRLTPAQARLTGLILSGHSRTDAARRLNVSENTIRSHLKQIYLKTNTHGQMELVQLHAKSCTDHF
jgi:DNA-binding CsgD family transcriptional regulator